MGNINNLNSINMNIGHAHPFERMFANMPRFFAFPDDEEQPQTRGVSEEFLENLPPMKADKDADCNICLEKVGTNGNKSCELPCGHAFDKSCLSTWLKEHDNPHAAGQSSIKTASHSQTMKNSNS